MTADGSRRKSRFSLLLLEDREVLLSDIAVSYHFVPDISDETTKHALSSFPTRLIARPSSSVIPGRAKVGTHNLFFDSDDWRDPIIRIPLISVTDSLLFKNIIHERNEERGGTSPRHEEVSRTGSVVVIATKVFLQRKSGTDHPYVEVNLKGEHSFTPLYTSASQLRSEIFTLLNVVAQDSYKEREQSLTKLVRERESCVPFDITLLEHGAQENAIMEAPASVIGALSRAPGRFRITLHNVYFMPIHGEISSGAKRFPVSDITAIRKLRHGCHDAALEITHQGIDRIASRRITSTLMISFAEKEVREQALCSLLGIIQHDVLSFGPQELEATLSQWRNGQLSNFEYLMYLNLASGRSFNDLSQYPIFPWVVQDYESDVLDLENSESFRDLSKPMGVLNAKRFEHFYERFQEMPLPKFFYGTHYSTPAYTINYLVRAAPAAMLRLQNGKFDSPDRLFYSIRNTWEGVLRNQGDLKELIPEFYALDFSSGDCSGVLPSSSSPGQFLENVLGLDLGVRQDGKRVGDVELPPWAEGSAELFVRRNREALESRNVSSKLHLWIDLIFGVKSKDEKAFNLFYTDVALPSSLDDTSNLPSNEVSQIETVYLEFGRTPERLFGHPHPPRVRSETHLELAGYPSSKCNAVEAKHDHRYSADGTRIPRALSASELVPAKLSSLSVKRTSQNREQTRCLSVGSITRRKSVPVGMFTRPTSSPYSRIHGEGHQGRINESYGYSKPGGSQSGKTYVRTPPLYRIISSSEHSSILDISVIPNIMVPSESGTFEASTSTLCTIWSDGYLKVHKNGRLLRSKHVGEVCCIASFSSNMVACGTFSGDIGVYCIDTGRFETSQRAAHDAEIHVLEYVQDANVLLSGSKDASLKIWQIERHTGSLATLRLFQELDAESCVIDISVSFESDVIESTANCIDGHLLIAACTMDASILVWKIDLQGRLQSFLEPLWRKDWDDHLNATEGRIFHRKRRLTWLNRKQDRKNVLASVHPEDRRLRIWDLHQTDMAAAEVLLSSDGALCIASRRNSETFLVGGTNGRINEYDSTGFCLGYVFIGQCEVKSILVRDDNHIYVGVDDTEVFVIDESAWCVH